MSGFGAKLLLALSLAALFLAGSAKAAESQAFKAAEQELVDGSYQLAEADFAEFVQKNPNSPRLLEAVLYQAEARIKLGKYDAALSLLSAYEKQSGTLGDWYLLCRGEALLAKGDYLKAEADFTRLLEAYPGSPRRLTAVVNAAAARTRLSQWPQVTELLGQTNGVFQLVAATNHASSDVIRGYLLLSEAQLAQRDTRAAELSLQALAQSPLDATNNWQRQYLLCRVYLTDGRLEAARLNTTNLLLLAEATGQRSFQAQSFAFQAGLLERAGQNQQALDVYTNNLSPGTPIERQRQAMLKTSELSLALGKADDAVLKLESFLAQFPTNSTADLALLTIGELRLRQFESALMTNHTTAAVTNSPDATNYLMQAVKAFRDLPQNYLRSSLLGKAQLDLGWCHWLAGELTNSEAAFQKAVALLPPSSDQANALFKLADTQFRLGQYPAAISNYNGLVDRYAEWPEVRTNLSEHALYQVLCASQANQDLNHSTNALVKLLSWFPEGAYTDRALRLSGQQMGPQYPSIVRALYCEVAKSATNSQLLPELQLAIASTYETENKWEDAARLYDAWVTTFTNAPALGRAEYLRASANDRAGHETNALIQFTNFVARFPTNEYAPLAQWRVADYLCRAGNLQQAEINYKTVFLNWPASSLAYPARMMAGRMAVDRQDWDHAPDYFLGLYNDQNCPANLRGQALFAYGDTLMSRDSTNKLSDYREAFKTFDLICKSYPTNQIGALAWGQKAICLLQLAQIPQDLSLVTNGFQMVIDSTNAGATARSIAQVGLGFTLEKIADTKTEPEKTDLLNEARLHYARVFYDKDFLREGEEPDSFWTREAGTRLERLAERLQLREQAINIYRRLQEMFPALRLEEKIKALRSQA